MKQYFSLRLYLEGLKRIKIAGIAASIAVILLNAALPVIQIMDNKWSYFRGERSVTSVSPGEFMPFSCLLLIFSAVFVYSMFSYLNERNRSDFFHAIPQKRLCVYLSFLAAILSWIAAILLASTIVNTVLYGFAKFYTVNLSVIFVTPLVYLLGCTMIVGFMALAMTLTGTVVSNLLIFTLLLLFVRTVGQIFITCLEELAPVVEIESSFLRFFRIDFFLPFSLFTVSLSTADNCFGNGPLLLYSLGVALLLLVLGGVVYVFRRSETATKSAPNKVMQHIYRSAVTLPFFLLLVMNYICNGFFEPSLMTILFILAILVYCIFELMTTKKIRMLVKALPLIVIPIALSAVFTGAVYLERNAILNDIPTVDEIASVGTYTPDRVYSHTYHELRTVDCTVENEEARAIVQRALTKTVDEIRNEPQSYPGQKEEYWQTITVRICLKNGRKMGRVVKMSADEYKRFHELLLESDEYINGYLALPDSREVDSVRTAGFSVNDEAAKRLWASFLLEYSALTKEQKIAYHDIDEYNDTASVGTLIVDGMYRFVSFRSQYRIYYEYTPKTAQMLLEAKEQCGWLFFDTEEIDVYKKCLADTERSYDIRFEMTYLNGKYVEEVDFFVGNSKTLPREDVIGILDFITARAGISSYSADKNLVHLSIGFYSADKDIGAMSTLDESDGIDAVVFFRDEDLEELRAKLEPLVK